MHCNSVHIVTVPASVITNIERDEIDGARALMQLLLAAPVILAPKFELHHIAGAAIDIKITPDQLVCNKGQNVTAHIRVHPELGTSYVFEDMETNDIFTVPLEFLPPDGEYKRTSRSSMTQSTLPILRRMPPLSSISKRTVAARKRRVIVV